MSFAKLSTQYDPFCWMLFLQMQLQQQYFTLK